MIFIINIIFIIGFIITIIGAGLIFGFIFNKLGVFEYKKGNKHGFNRARNRNRKRKF